MYCINSIVVENESREGRGGRLNHAAIFRGHLMRWLIVPAADDVNDITRKRFNQGKQNEQEEGAVIHY